MTLGHVRESSHHDTLHPCRTAVRHRLCGEIAPPPELSSVYVVKSKVVSIDAIDRLLELNPVGAEPSIAKLQKQGHYPVQLSYDGLIIVPGQEPGQLTM